MHKSELKTNVFITELISESEKLPVHGSMVKPMVEPQSNQWRHKYILYILLKSKINLKKYKYKLN